MATFYYPESFRASAVQWANAPLQRAEVLAPTAVGNGSVVAPTLPANVTAPYYHLYVSLTGTDDPATVRGQATVTLEDAAGNDIGSYVFTSNGSEEPLRIDPSQVADVSVTIAEASGAGTPLTLAMTASIPVLDSF